MSELSKQALQVENTTSFPNNTTGYITPTLLRTFNSNVIDSTVNQTGYTSNSGSWNVSISNLNAFTASQQPSFNSLNAFTASQLVINSGVNVFTQSANASINRLDTFSSSFNAYTASINQIRSNGVVLGTSTIFNLVGPGTFFSASLVQNVQGNIATLTFTSDNGKVNTSSFNSYTASTALTQSAFSASVSSDFTTVYSTISTLSNKTGSYATTGSNTFNGNQTIAGTIAASSFVSASNGFYSGPNVTALTIGEGSNVRFLSGSDYYNIQLVPGDGDMAFSRSGTGNVKVMTLAGVAGNNTTFQNNPVVFNNSVSSLTVNAQSTAISGSGSYSLQASTITQNASTVTTTASSSFIGTVGITGQSGNDGRAILLGHSGSLVLGNSTTNATYADLAFVSSSVGNANTNLIFKSNTNTASLTVSGSANLFVPATAPTAEFKRYIGGSGNLILSATAIPQITGSNQISPTFSNNTFQGAGFFMRTPVSSSTWTISGNTWNNFGNTNLGTAQATSFVSASAGVTISNNFIGGTLAATAYKTQLYGPFGIIQSYQGGSLTMNNDSSSITFVNSIQAGALTINNSYNSGLTTNANGLALSAGNAFLGSFNQIYASGSNTTATTRQIIASAMIGMANSASVNLNGDNSQLNSVALIGHSLAVTGSSAIYSTAQTGSDRGTVIVGRFNTEVLSGNTVFAVGSGTSYSTRKNAILVDSGSNTYVEGSLNISGSTSVTGSVYGNVSALTISSNTASMNLATGNFFTLNLVSGSTTHLAASNIRPGQTINLLLTQPSVGTGSVSYNSTFDFPAGGNYVATPITSSKDILSLITFDSSILYATSINNLG